MSPMRSMATAVMIAHASGGNMKEPEGFLGLRWGEDASTASVRVGLQCDVWTPWLDGSAFESCSNPTHDITALAEPARVRLIRQGKRLAALQLHFADCHARQRRLREAIRTEFAIEAPDDDDPHVTWESGALVRLEHDTADGSCTLTIAGPAFGRAYADHRLRESLGGLSAGMKP